MVARTTVTFFNRIGHKQKFELNRVAPLSVKPRHSATHLGQPRQRVTLDSMTRHKINWQELDGW